MDWKSSLEALKDNLPPGEAASQDPAPDSVVSHVRQPRLDILLDRKGRKGKDATIIAGFTMPDEEVDELAARLKQRLGTGGSSRGGEILIQGDKRRQVLDLLVSLGYKARII